MSPLPISRSALDRLGERLAANDEISDDDYGLLSQVLTAYQAALAEAQDRLVGLGYAPTTRVKTTAVLVDKLRRETGMKLKGVQDIAGARLVVDGGRLEQDEVVKHIAAAFRNGSREPRVKDRRAEPSAGYRAVHVVVTVQDMPVEVQVRTQWQDQWAQAVESLGDKWGRGIRYGLGPDEPHTVIRPPLPYTRDDLWTDVLQLSDTNDVVESAGHFLAALDRLAVDPTDRDALGVVALAVKTLGGPEPPTPDDVLVLTSERDRYRTEYEKGARHMRERLVMLAVVADAVP